MKFKTIIYYALTIATLFLFNSCNKESYIEDFGFVSELESEPNVSKGRILFYATNGFIESCSSGLQIFIDGENVGSLIQSTQIQPNCGDNNTTALTVVLEVGTHSYNASGSGQFCPSYSGNTFVIEEGVCLVVDFRL